jgi:peptidoglycan/xylan/chitin deacetylase (PgdA/CDA1 family)
MSSFVISLDFELFWGVSDSRSIEGYRRNVEGVWDAIPRLLALFRQYDVRATWATVGMLMCRDYEHWERVRPAVMPSYARKACSNYEIGDLARQHPRLFFARPLVQQILDTPGQELASHTYSHFYCDEEGVTSAQFHADLMCAQAVAAELGTSCKSLVFPRNQVRPEFLDAARSAGTTSWRGNPAHPLYRGGHRTPGGIAGRAVRFADAWLPLTGQHVAHPVQANGMVNVPASMFLRPYSPTLAALEPLKLARIKRSMTHAARTGGICHLWWHPHNFGANLERNLSTLETILQHFDQLRASTGMRSASMSDLAVAEAA